MSQNPNWPLIDVAVSFDTGPANAMPAAHWCSMVERTLGSVSTNRGRQYELDQVQTGTWTGSLQNKDGALDPSNTASPFYPKVLPYRSFRHRAQYPPTVNILTPDQATAGKSTLPLGTVPPWVSVVQVGGTPGITTASFTGASNKYSLGYAASAGIGGGISFFGFSVKPGVSHAGQIFFSDAGNKGLQLQASFQWLKADGTVLSTVTGTAQTITSGGQTLTVVGTAPAAACGAVFRVLSTNSVASAATLLGLAVQVEYSGSATTPVTPNTWYSIFTGYVERWPQTWSMNGQFGQSNLTVVDAFGYLSQQKLLSSAYEEALLLNPDFLYPLDETPPAQPSTPALFYDLTSNHKPATLTTFTTGDTSMVPGDSLQATGGWLPQGIGGPVLGVQIHSGDFDSQQLDLTGGGRNPAGPGRTSWTRVIAFRAPKLPAAAGQSAITLYQFNGLLSASGVGSGVSVVGNIDGSGVLSTIQVLLVNAGVLVAALQTTPAALAVSDGGWHLLIISVSDPTAVFGWLDNTAMSLISVGNFNSLLAGGAGGSDLVNQQGYGSLASANVSPIIEYAFVGQFPLVFNTAQASQLYSVFRYGGTGLGVATSATRYSDILRWGSWAGASAIDNFTTGETVAYGPATEMNAPASSSGTDVVTMLQSVVDTEAGTHYVAADGTITFKARRSRYNQSTPVVTFGENTGAGEVPYTTVQTGYDPTRIANDVSVSQTQTSATQRALDLNSAAAYGDIQLSRTVNTLNSYEQVDAAQYLLNRNSQPVQRIEGISVNVGANPAIWTSMLALEFGTRVRVMRRPPLGAATIQVDGFVEQLNWNMDDKGGATVDLQISVNNQQQYWQLDSSTFSVLDSTTVMGY